MEIDLDWKCSQGHKQRVGECGAIKPTSTNAMKQENREILWTLYHTVIVIELAVVIVLLFD